ncbi:MAG: hypothetical protein ACREFH_10345 [Stellaceae bacterium]
MRLQGFFRAMGLAAALAGCAGRAPQPVAVVQSQDPSLDCTAIAAEVKAGDARIQELGSEEGAKAAQNVAAGVAGLFIWPLWFAMDFQGAASTETTALQSRQEYLATLAAQKRCGAPPAVTVAYAQPRAGTAAPVVPVVPVVPRGLGSAPMATADPGRTVLSPVTIYHPYHPAAYVDVR